MRILPVSAFTAQVAGGIAIDATNFTSTVLQTRVCALFDLDKDNMQSSAKTKKTATV